MIIRKIVVHLLKRDIYREKNNNMAKKIIKLTESELKAILTETINSILVEASTEFYTVPSAIASISADNINRGKDLQPNKNGEIRNELDRNMKARSMMNHALALFLINRMGNIEFYFLKYDDEIGQNTAVKFQMQDIKSFNANEITFSGCLTKGYNNAVLNKGAVVKYDFNTKVFSHSTWVQRNKRDMPMVFITKGQSGQKNVATLHRLLFLVDEFGKAKKEAIESMTTMQTLQEFYDTLMLILQKITEE